MSQFKTENSVASSNNKRWTAKDDQILRQMVKEKATTAHVAIALGRTKASVWSRKSMLGLDGRLASSKGKDVSAPTTLRHHVRNAHRSETQPVQKTERVKPVKATNSDVINLDLKTISKLAKQSGAKIVITFE